MNDTIQVLFIQTLNRLDSTRLTGSSVQEDHEEEIKVCKKKSNYETVKHEIIILQILIKGGQSWRTSSKWTEPVSQSVDGMKWMSRGLNGSGKVSSFELASGLSVAKKIEEYLCNK